MKVGSLRVARGALALALLLALPFAIAVAEAPAVLVIPGEWESGPPVLNETRALVVKGIGTRPGAEFTLREAQTHAERASNVSVADPERRRLSMVTFPATTFGVPGTWRVDGPAGWLTTFLVDAPAGSPSQVPLPDFPDAHFEGSEGAYEGPALVVGRTVDVLARGIPANPPDLANGTLLSLHAPGRRLVAERAATVDERGLNESLLEARFPRTLLDVAGEWILAGPGYETRFIVAPGSIEGEASPSAPVPVLPLAFALGALAGAARLRGTRPL